MDPGEESFSLSSFGFNSSFELYSSDEDDDYANGQQRDKRSKDDIDAYIELELPPAALVATTPPPPPPPIVLTQIQATDDDDDNELEFRISFSAVVPFPGFRPSSINFANIVYSKESSSSGEDANDQLTAAKDSGPQPMVGSALPCMIRRRPISDYTTVSIFPPAWKRFQPPVDDDYADDCRIKDINSWELVRSRKASSKINSAANGGITKLLMKLRCIIISGLGSMRASIHPITVNSRQQRCPNSRRITLAKPFDKWFTRRKMDEQQLTTTRTNGGSSSEMRSSSKVLGMKFDAMRMLFGTAAIPLKSTGSKTRLDKGCPTSIKSSPVHHQGDTSLVSAAIAHCKKSFVQNDDFSF